MNELKQLKRSARWLTQSKCLINVIIRKCVWWNWRVHNSEDHEIKPTFVFLFEKCDHPVTSIDNKAHLEKFHLCITNRVVSSQSLKFESLKDSRPLRGRWGVDKMAGPPSQSRRDCATSFIYVCFLMLLLFLGFLCLT